jgi:hypothetical protein
LLEDYKESKVYEGKPISHARGQIIIMLYTVVILLAKSVREIWVNKKVFIFIQALFSEKKVNGRLY